MMCDPCVAAGYWNAEGDTIRAEKWHSGCAYPQSCTCQHRIGEGHVNEGVNKNQEADGQTSRVVAQKWA